MARCTYVLKDKNNIEHEFKSYKELVNYLSEEFKNGNLALEKQVNDILFSKEEKGERQRIVYGKIKSLSDSYKHSDEFVATSTPGYDGDPRLKGSDNVVTAQDFINSPSFNPGGKENVFVLDRPKFKAERVKEYMDNGVKREDAEPLAEEDVANWDQMSDNARVFHKIIVSANDYSSDAWYNEQADGTAFNGPVRNDLRDAYEKIDRAVKLKNGRNKYDPDSLGGQVMRNVNLSAKMQDGRTMIGHIDYLVVREDGSLDIYNVKTSGDPVNWWGKVKKDNYRYEMSFLKRMLAQNGIDVSNARTNIIPVYFEYGTSPDTGRRIYKDVKRIWVEDVMPLETSGGRLISETYDTIAGDYIYSDFDSSKLRMDFMPEVTRMMSVAFKDDSIKSEGLRLSAEDWVRRNWAYCRKKPKPEGGYKISLIDTDLRGSADIEVSDSHEGTGNKEFVEKIREIMQSNTDRGFGSGVARLLKEDFIRAFNQDGFFSTRVKGIDAEYMRNRTMKYFSSIRKTTSDDGTVTFDSDWKVLDSPVLDQLNILAFFNKKSGQVDFITFTDMDLDQKRQFKAGRDNLLGAHIHDVNDYNFNLLADYGNIELMRNMAIINEMAAQFEEGTKMGEISIISTSGHGSRKGMTVDVRDAEHYWDTFVKVINKATGGEAGFVNNFRNGRLQYISQEELLMREFNNIRTMDCNGVDVSAIDSLKDVIERHVDRNGTNVNGLLDAGTVANKKLIIREFLKRLKELLDGNGVKVSNTKQLAQLSRETYNTTTNLMAKLYISASKLLTIYEGDINLQNQDMNWMQMNFVRTPSVKNDIVRRNGEIVQGGIDAIRDRMSDVYYNDVMNIFHELYKEAGYGKMRNALIGDQAVVYKNMFVYDSDGKNTFLLKNPYDTSENLKPYERKFLKKILFEFYKVRCRLKGERQEISGIEDSKLYNDMPDGYLRLPLQRKSVVSKRSDIKHEVEALGESLHTLITNPKKRFQEFMNWLKDSSHNTMVERAMKNMQTINPYYESETDLNERISYIQDKGWKYFENDIENVFIDYLFAQTRCEEMDNVLFRTNAIELALRLRGITEYDDASAPQIEKIVDLVQKYCKVNIFEGSIMDKAGQMLEKSLKGLRKLTSEILLGNSPANWMRDQIQMFANNFASAMIGFNTDLKFNSLFKAYNYVWLDVLKSIKGMSVLEQLNTRYGISSFDASKVSSKLKTQGGALFEEGNWIYWSMKNPDYVNRMVLFVARAQQDGAWDAYGLDENGVVRYNWKKDKRFDVLAKGEAGRRENQAEYDRQYGKYCDMIDQFNKERPERMLTKEVKDFGLPDAYTAKEIKAIKSLAEKLYGSYDRASRGMLENMALGRNFAWFITWFNGINDTYTGPTRIDTSTVKWKQMLNDKGEKLFRDRDTGELTTTDTGIPAYEADNVMTSSVFVEMRKAFQALMGGTSPREYYNETVRDNPQVMQLYKKLCLDMSVTALFSLLLGLVVKPAYKQFKSQADGERFFQNVCVELLYRGWSRAFDVFSGPMVMLKYFGDSTNPVYYDMGNKMITDLYKVVAGKEAFGSTMLTYSAFYRNMQDSYKMWVKTHKDQLDIE